MCGNKSYNFHNNIHLFFNINVTCSPKYKCIWHKSNLIHYKKKTVAYIELIKFNKLSESFFAIITIFRRAQANEPNCMYCV